MKRVFICSRLSAETKQQLAANVQAAKYYSVFAATRRNAAVFVPHLLYTQFLSDDVPIERTLGINSGLAFLDACSELLAFTVDGIISPGMLQECKYAISKNIPIKWFAVKTTDTGVAINIVALGHLADNEIPTSQSLLLVEDASKAVSSMFSKMEAALKSGIDYSSMESEIDDMLDTALVDRDLEAEAIYEELNNREI